MYACLRLIGILACIGLWACASGHQAPFPATQPPQRELAHISQRLQTATAKSDALSLSILGQVRYADFVAPVYLVQFAHRTANAPRILVTAGVHGNEPAGVECAVRLVERLAQTPQRFPACSLEIIPLVNPWGWVHDVRFNQQGFDVNRDFASFKTSEAKIIRDHQQRTRYDLIVDLHEDPAARGFYMYQYGRSDRTVVAPIITAITQMGHPIEQDVKMIALKTENGVIDAPMWGLWYMKLTGQLSITNYGRLYNSTNVFTIETPTRLNWDDRTQMQQKALGMLLKATLETNGN